ncbi:hypothetical protein DP107_01560 [Haloglomus irregulare]|uniref:Uncharacterized protein n=1 Tax=Haloglomus irregulare TaxID=2234134 RepID=A0A554NF06_9EURY|nr:hypothetical protein DP107_01560 [Haloglomus irregulare]
MVDSSPGGPSNDAPGADCREDGVGVGVCLSVGVGVRVAVGSSAGVGVGPPASPSAVGPP